MLDDDIGKLRKRLLRDPRQFWPLLQFRNNLFLGRERRPSHAPAANDMSEEKGITARIADDHIFRTREGAD